MGHVDDDDGVPARPGGAVFSGRGVGRCGWRVNGGGCVGTVGGGDGFTDRASPSTPLPPADGPPLRDTTVRRAHRRRCMHARTHAHTHVTKRDEELRMRTAEKCNTESPAARRVVTHTHRTDDYDRSVHFIFKC